MGGRRRIAALPLLLAAASAAAALAPGLAGGERSQRGDLIVSLDGRIRPLQLSRHELDPVHVQLAGGLESDDGGLLPRVDRVEIGLPAKGVVSVRGLPVCTVRRLRNATSEGALAACRPALVGRGTVRADVLLPGQGPFRVHARLFVFNGPRKDGHRLLLLHAYSRRPPTVVVMPFKLERHAGRFGLTIGADLPAALGPWPHLARFQMLLGRRYRADGVWRDFLRATCPVPKRFTAGFFSFAQVTFTLAGGRQVSQAITRGCRPQ